MITIDKGRIILAAVLFAVAMAQILLELIFKFSGSLKVLIFVLNFIIYIYSLMVAFKCVPTVYCKDK